MNAEWSGCFGERILHTSAMISPGYLRKNHSVDIITGKDSEVVEKFGGPCRGRTYGPLIKSQFAPLRWASLGSSVS